jgi:hypothetical protein
MDTKDNIDLSVNIIQMQPPIPGPDNTTTRQWENKDEKTKNLVSFEAALRRSAYQNTTINTDEFFFDDTDMHSDYYLVVVYDNKSDTPLLSSRHYFDKTIISNYLKGDYCVAPELTYLGEKFDLNRYSEGSIFLADRLSGNMDHAIYQQHRKRIFSMYHQAIFKNYFDCSLLLMVRKEKQEPQLSKYLQLGFSVIGSTIHKGKEHSIILMDFKNA